MADKDAAEKGQVTADAAEVYEELFVPALFEPWAKNVAEAAEIRAGEDVLDVGCGTGVLAREAARRAWPGGSVTGLDLNAGMLSVARRLSPEITWVEGPAEALEFQDDRFDAVVCQFSLMYFEDQVTAIEEMWRVLRPGGRLALAVWDEIERVPGYLELAGLMERMLAPDAATGLRKAFSLGTTTGLRQLFEGAGVPEARVATLDGEARFPSLEAFLEAEVKGWTVSDQVSEEQYEALSAEGAKTLDQFVQDDQTVRFPLPAHIVTAEKA